MSSLQALLRHWQAEEVSLAKARKLWFRGQTTSNCNMGSFKAKGDRMALCAYAITGQLLEAEVGSVVMFAVPDSLGCGERAINEHFLQASSSAVYFSYFHVSIFMSSYFPCYLYIQYLNKKLPLLFFSYFHVLPYFHECIADCAATSSLYCAGLM